jgi:lysophospholipase L1-like esterase
MFVISGSGKRASLKAIPLLLLSTGVCLAQGEHWVATWGTAQQLMAGTNLPGGPTPASAPPRQTTPSSRRFPIPPKIQNFNNQTVRMILRTSLGGTALRVRLSSAIGSPAVELGSAHVALHAKESAVVPGSDHALTFGGKPFAMLYGGQTLVSDPIRMEVPPMRELAVSLYLPKETGQPTQHLFALNTTYLSKNGDQTASESLGDASTSESYYWLSGVDVLAPAGTGTVIAFGDSITDGDQSTPNTNGMWPAILAQRLQANRATSALAMVNEGISGNRVLGNDSSALARFSRDALQQPGVQWVMILEGINDITGGTRGATPSLKSDDLIAAYRQMIETAHLAGVRMIGCTITPYGGSGAYNAAGEEIRETVNHWIRTSGAFDAVVDFDAATRDAADPHRFRAEVDSPDHLHPANPGYKRMGESIDLSIFVGAQSKAPLDPSLTSIFIAGDSTAAEGNPDAVGWGKPFAFLFDQSHINIVNRARGGRSARTFVQEGLWDALIHDVKTGDYVLIQFGHNDGGEINGQRIARGSLPGLGEETQEIDNHLTKQHETVHTFGWYMRKMIRETKAKGATPVVLSLTVRNIWKDGHVERGSGQYSQWSREITQAEGVRFLDLTNIVADRYEKIGESATGKLFPKDHTHTNDAGALLNAQYVVSGLKALRENAAIGALSPTGRVIETARPAAVLMAPLPVPRGASTEFYRWLNLPLPADPALPSLFLIGDSTVRNGRGDGVNGQWGWGDPLAAYFDPSKINVVNRAVGGTGARTFLDIGYWDRVMSMLKSGDVVIMQFGHNDNGPTGPLPGIGDQTEERTNPVTGGPQTVHTFGWYLQRYITEIKSRGAVPIVCTLVPRNIWENGKIARPRDSHADWARQVAASQNVALLDMHELIARQYDPMDEARVTELFADKRVHTTREGAEMSAGIVVSAIRGLRDNPLAPYLRTKPAEVW